VARRAAALQRAADLLERERGRLIHLLQVEAGKTIDDALSEVREAVDFCRYYAVQARTLFHDGERLPGPDGRIERAAPARAAACSWRSRPGTSPSRSSSARSRRRLLPATASWPSPPSRRR
jgi:acyl-CoA reductase-like NAD-dependent aldehyde dehydrogenase